MHVLTPPFGVESVSLPKRQHAVEQRAAVEFEQLRKIGHVGCYTVNGQKCDVLHLGKNVSLLAVQGIKRMVEWKGIEPGLRIFSLDTRQVRPSLMLRLPGDIHVSAERRNHLLTARLRRQIAKNQLESRAGDKRPGRKRLGRRSAVMPPVRKTGLKPYAAGLTHNRVNASRAQKLRHLRSGYRLRQSLAQGHGRGNDEVRRRVARMCRRRNPSSSQSRPRRCRKFIERQQLWVAAAGTGNDLRIIDRRTDQQNHLGILLANPWDHRCASSRRNVYSTTRMPASRQASSNIRGS